MSWQFLILRPWNDVKIYLLLCISIFLITQMPTKNPWSLYLPLWWKISADVFCCFFFFFIWKTSDHVSAEGSLPLKFNLCFPFERFYIYCAVKNHYVDILHSIRRKPTNNSDGIQTGHWNKLKMTVLGYPSHYWLRIFSILKHIATSDCDTI